MAAAAAAAGEGGLREERLKGANLHLRAKLNPN